MLTNEPLVSILIPVFNREDFIEETINSILNQTYTNWELIIVDDGSCDNTLSIIKKKEKESSKIKLVNRESEPKGASKCRNIALNNAVGEYVIFLDSDDLIAEFCLSQRVKLIEKHNCDVIITYQLIFNKNPYDTNILVNKKKDVDPILRFFCLTQEADVPWVNNSSIWKRKTLIDYKIKWNEDLVVYQDIDFNLNIFKHKLKYFYSDSKPDCFWRLGEHSSIGKQSFSLEKANSISDLLKNMSKTALELNIHKNEYNKLIKKNHYYLIVKKSLENNMHHLCFKMITSGIIQKYYSKKEGINLALFTVFRFLLLSDRIRFYITKHYEQYYIKSIVPPQAGGFKKYILEDEKC